MQELDRQKLGTFIARLRKEKGYTQKELARKLYISDKAVSKWETGMSMPDTALLIPLAELLEVSVTELLTGQQLPSEVPMESDQVEDIVKTAVSLSGGQDRRSTLGWGWILAYGVSVLMGGAGLLVCQRQGAIEESTLTSFILGIVFGGYFLFFARKSLPHYYDENRISGVHDGFFRMNVPGLVFNNSNWPYVIRVGKIWSFLSCLLFPYMELLMENLFPVFWQAAGLYIFLALILGGLFLPICYVCKKHE